MSITNFPELTIILRGYSFEEAMFVMEELAAMNCSVGIEVTTNNDDFTHIITEGNKKFGQQLLIGAGTVLTFSQANQAIDSGAGFLLGPQKFSTAIFSLARERRVVTVPSAFTPSEIQVMFDEGADIVKVFPAVTVGPTYFKQLAGPFGIRPLMAVGGVTIDNIAAFKKAGVLYFGVGSSMFQKADIQNRNGQAIRKSIQSYLDKLAEAGSEEDESH